MLLLLAGRLATLEPETINHACRTHLPQIVGAERASGYVFNSGRNRLELAWSSDGHALASAVELSPFRTDSVMALAVNRRRTWIAQDIDRELTGMGLAIERPFAAGYRNGSCIVAPVAAGTELMGVVNFADPTGAAAFDRARTEPLVEGLTHLLAATWRNVGTVSNLEQLARTDGLSGLANFRAFEESLSQEVGRARRYGAPLSLILMDVDNLKAVNDCYGHPAGDLLLREISRRIAGAIRETDLPARHGGDEFSVILPSTDEAAARHVTQRVCQAVNGAKVQWLRHVFRTSVSIACGQYDGASSPGRFLAAVDQDLYTHKRTEPAPARATH